MVNQKARYPKYKQVTEVPAEEVSKKRFKVNWIMLLIVIVAAGVVIDIAKPNLVSDMKNPPSKAQVVQETTPAAKVAKPSKVATAPATTQTVATNMCTGNTLPQYIVVSISQRHLWACNGTTVLFDSAVVTGMENLAADLTPTGTYHIYAKDTNLYLRGSDSTGSWNDYVNYWMPFLNNQYGTYGFHDATWRPANAFGNISPYSSDASHGCVELPLATAKWLFGWAQIGTTLTIES